MENSLEIKSSNIYEQYCEEDIEIDSEENLSILKCFQKILEIKRIAKSVKGGRIVTYRAIVIVGNNTSKVGIGVGCADDSSFAIKKAFINGKQNMISVPITKTKSIPYGIKLANGACQIMLSRANKGNGIIASGPIKTLIEYAGIKNITAKQFGSNNILNNIKITLLALTQLKEKVDFLKIQSNKSYEFSAKLMEI